MSENIVAMQLKLQSKEFPTESQENPAILAQ